jgi:hypothetical protein
MFTFSKHLPLFALTNLVVLGATESVANAQVRGRFSAAAPSMRYTAPLMGRSLGTQGSAISRQPSTRSPVSIASGRSIQGTSMRSTRSTWRRSFEERRDTARLTSRSIDSRTWSVKTQPDRTQAKPAIGSLRSPSRSVDRRPFTAADTRCRFPRWRWPYGWSWWGGYPWWWQWTLPAVVVASPASATIEPSNVSLYEPNSSDGEWLTMPSAPYGNYGDAYRYGAVTILSRQGQLMLNQQDAAKEREEARAVRINNRRTELEQFFRPSD